MDWNRVFLFFYEVFQLNDLSTIYEQLNLNNNIVSQEATLYDSILVKYSNKDFFSKFLNICLYQADFSVVAGINRNSEIIKYFKSFLILLAEDIKSTSSINIQQKPILSAINTLKKILDIKEDPAARLLTYDTIDKHFSNVGIFSSKIISNVKENRISNFQIFKSELEDIIKMIQVYNELKQVKLVLDELDFIKQESHSDDQSALNLLKNCKTIITKAHSIFSTLKSVGDDDEIEKYLEFYDESSNKLVISNLFKYLSKSFNFFKTNYKLLDDNIDGLESSSVYLISAASNNGKSIFLINLMRNVILNKLNKFESNDMILFITLEDDIYKVYRRFLSIFGNISTKIAKKLFVHCSSIIQESKDIDIKFKSIEQNINRLFEKITQKAIYQTTKGRCRLGLIYSNDQSYTMLDVSRFIDKKKAEGYNVKAVFIDYLDYMLPSNATVKDKEGSQYSSHGAIVKEMKLVSREYGLPIITVTQNNRMAENAMQTLDNSVMGDSYNKVRFAETILMLRQEQTKSITDPSVMKDVFDANYNLANLTTLDYHSSLQPLYVKITKAKEGAKNCDKYHIFNPLNLRIYDSFNNVITDMEDFKLNNDELLKDIESVGLVINENIFFDVDNQDEIDSLII